MDWMVEKIDQVKDRRLRFSSKFIGSDSEWWKSMEHGGVFVDA